MAKITGISIKVDKNLKPDVANKNKIEASDINEIVSVVNFNDETKTEKGGYNGSAKDLKDAIDVAIFDGAITYQTLSDLPTSPVPSEGTPAKVANDSVSTNNGNWSVFGGVWVQDASVISNILNSEDIEVEGSGLLFTDRDKTIESLGYKIIRSDFDFTAIPIGYDNSIWEIRHFHDLLGATITLPSNVTLKFNGGKFGNGTIIGDNTKIKAELEHIFVSDVGVDVTLNGEWSVKESYPQWFGFDINSNYSQSITDSFSLAYLSKSKIKVIEDVTINIPTNAPDLQSVFDNISVDKGISITVNIETSHLLTSGLRLLNNNYSNFKIVSEDSTVKLAIDFVGANTDGIPEFILGETPRQPFMVVAIGAVSPLLSTVIDMEKQYGTGIQVAEGEAIVDQYCGVINAGFRGIQVHGRANIYLANFSGASGSGIRLQQASSCNARAAIVDDCCKTDDLTNSAVYVSRGSILEFRGGSAQNSWANGIISRRSRISADDANVSGANLNGVDCESASNVSFINGIATSVNGYPVRCRFGSTIACNGATLGRTSSNPNLFVDEGGVITVNSGTKVQETLTGEDKIRDFSNVTFLNVYDKGGLIHYRDGIGNGQRLGSSHTYSGSLGSFTTTEKQRFVVTLDRTYESVLCELSIQCSAISNTNTLHPSAKYLFRLQITSSGGVSIAGLTAVQEYIFDSSLHFSFTGIGGNTGYIEISNPTSSTLSRNSYKMELLSNRAITFNTEIV